MAGRSNAPDMRAARAQVRAETARVDAATAEAPNVQTLPDGRVVVVREDGTVELDLPVGTYREAATHLRRPFTADAVKWKVQTLLGAPKGKPEQAKGGLIVGYIDARLVIERLNLVCPHLWTERYESVGQSLMVCHLTLDGISRCDVGEGSGKALWSDAFKRAAVKFGVGVSLYAMSAVTFWRAKGEDDTDGGRLRPNYREHLELDELNRAWLREKYQAWLDDRGSKMFGPPLDHGDVEGAVGDPEDPDTREVAGDAQNAGDEPEALPQLTDARANELRKRAAELNRGSKRLLPGEFKQRLAEAGVSHEGLEKLVNELEASS